MSSEKNTNSGIFSICFSKALKIYSLKKADIARKTGIKPSRISEYAQGKIEPSTENIEKIANCFDLSLADFFSLKDEKNTAKIKQWECYDFIAGEVEKILDRNGEKFSIAKMAEFLSVHVSKISKWKEGQAPDYEDLQFLAQKFNLSSDWLLLGTGAPTHKHESPNFNPEYVEICDTLFNWVRSLPDPREVVATIGQLRFEELNDCMDSRKLPPFTSIVRWIHHYKLNANYLLAQIGKPYLTLNEYKETGDLDYLRERRDDLKRHTLNDDNDPSEDFEELTGKKPPKGPNATTELIYMINDLNWKIRKLESDVENSEAYRKLKDENYSIYQELNELRKANNIPAPTAQQNALGASKN